MRTRSETGYLHSCDKLVDEYEAYGHGFGEDDVCGDDDCEDAHDGGGVDAEIIKVSRN